MIDIIQQFIEAMRAAGFEPARPSDIVECAGNPPGRFQCAGDKPGSKNGAYTLHLDEPVRGWFQNHKLGVEQTWKPDLRPLSPEEKRRFRAEMDAKRAEREKAVAEARARAAAECEEIWNTSAKPDAGHPYLERKGVGAHALRLVGDRLVVPVTKNRELVGLQYISPAGEKLFHPGSDISGAYAVLGKPKTELLIAEGYATAATLYELTRIPVAIAFNAGNLLPVARAMRERLPDARIVICADNDRFTETPIKNPGIHYAGLAAKAIGGEFVRPFFLQRSKGTDFNDLALEQGNEEVRFQIANGRASWDERSPTVPAVVEIGPPSDFDLRLEYPHMRLDKNGEPTSPLSTLENVKELLRRLNASARYNVIKKEIEITVPGHSYIQDKALVATLILIRSMATIARLPTDRIEDFVLHAAVSNPFNPVITWINSKPWDGVSRLEEFYSTVTAVDESDPEVKTFKETLIKRWMLSAVAAASRPNGVSAHGVLVFQAPQYLGKTAWFKRLAPPDLKVIADGLTLDLRDKDSIFRVLSNWLVELGEIDATFKKSDISALKAFITRDFDSIRRPFERSESQFPRRTVFFGSVNEDDYLHDPTGNRRYWTIAVEDINHKHNLDMQQIWAEFAVLLESGEPFYLTPEEMLELNARNKAHEAIDPILERVRKAYNWEEPMTYWRRITPTEVAMEIGISNPTQRDAKSAARAIREITGLFRIKVNGIYLYRVAPLRR